MYVAPIFVAIGDRPRFSGQGIASCSMPWKVTTRTYGNRGLSPIISERCSQIWRKILQGNVDRTGNHLRHGSTPNDCCRAG